ncbi:MAG TPA: hypothetical protein VNQ78_05270 [Paracoccus sp. (in: a-proteobacteria)]|uniref:hypothetical protein n=1 Tax=Paracoccus sp. TaxID=267 RepID=UPI002B9E9287|nr:hypothetical protein [Paracoccus sp. (in: a-proteobacteria)]HWL56072.1 hypothetical protein [Paracoccus sp. (in: a-proteobacteria)]
MQVVFHCGAHGTDLYRMVKTLMQNQEWLLANGVEALTPSRHREAFADALNSLNGQPASPEMEEVLLDAILESDEPQRIIFSTPTFLGKAERAISSDGLYANAGEKLAALANLFPSAEIEIFMALKNPATLLPYVFSQDGTRSYDQVMGAIPPESLRWAPAIRHMQAALPGHRLVLWCHEDTSLIWPEVVRSIATMPSDVPLKAGLQVLGDIMKPEGIEMIREEMSKEKRLTVEKRRAIFAAALSQHALPDQIEMEVTLPGWNQDLVDHISDLYDEDVAEIAAMPGVEFIAP